MTSQDPSPPPHTHIHIILFFMHSSMYSSKITYVITSQTKVKCVSFIHKIWTKSRYTSPLIRNLSPAHNFFSSLIHKRLQLVGSSRALNWEQVPKNRYTAILPSCTNLLSGSKHILTKDFMEYRHATSCTYSLWLQRHRVLEWCCLHTHKNVQFIDIGLKILQLINWCQCCY